MYSILLISLSLFFFLQFINLINNNYREKLIRRIIFINLHRLHSEFIASIYRLYECEREKYFIWSDLYCTTWGQWLYDKKKKNECLLLISELVLYTDDKQRLHSMVVRGFYLLFFFIFSVLFHIGDDITLGFWVRDGGRIIGKTNRRVNCLTERTPWCPFTLTQLPLTKYIYLCVYIY